jgi:hypothetical protein
MARRFDPIYKFNRPRAVGNDVESAINVALLETLADEFRIAPAVLGDEDFERFCFGRHICFPNPSQSTSAAVPPVRGSPLVMFPGTGQNGAANHNFQFFITCQILIVADQQSNVFAGCVEAPSRGFSSMHPSSSAAAKL